jgi:hypothetical protein
MQKWSIVRSLTVVVPIICVMAAIQAGLILGVGHAKERDIKWPSILMAVASATLLAAGVLRHYVDVYIHRTVRGISFIFVGIDALGDVFSLVSVIFQPTMDVLGMVIYGTELVLWIGVCMCGVYYNLVPWLGRNRVGAEGEASMHELPVAASREVRTPGDFVVASGIALNHLPSSTSVFRTPSASSRLRGVQ